MNRQKTAPSTTWWTKRVYISVAASGVLAYIAYRAYKSAQYSRLHSTFTRLRLTLENYANALSAASGSVSLLACELNDFLKSDATEIPQSLRQLNKLLQSSEVQSLLKTSVSTVTRGLTDGAMATFGELSDGVSSGPSALDTVIEAVLSDRGRSLLGMAVGIASKNITATFCEFLERLNNQQPYQQGGQLGIETIMRVLASDEGDRILSLLVTKSIRTAVSTYCDATAGVNIYNDMVSSIVKVEHRDAVSDIMSRTTAAFCKEVALAFRKASSAPVNSMRPIFQESGSVSRHLDESGRSSMDGSSSGCLQSAADAHIASTRGQSLTGLKSSRWLSQPSSSTASAMLSLKQNAPRPHPPPWVRQLVDLVKEKEVRSLAVDVVGSATREATKGVMETLVLSYGGASRGSPGSCTSHLSMSLSAVLTVAASLMMYVMCPPASLSA